MKRPRTGNRRTLGDYFECRQEPGRAGLPIMSVTQGDGLLLRNDLDRRTESTLEPQDHLLVSRGDIAYNMMRMWQGACGLADRDAMVSPSYVVLKPKSNVDTAFAYQWFKSERALHLLWAYSHGLTDDRLRLYFDDFCSIPATLPELELQNWLGRTLQRWDDATLQVRRLLLAKQERLDGLLARLIGARQSGPIELGWSREELATLVSLKSGGTPDRSNAEYWGGDIPWISAKDLKCFDLETSTDRLTPLGAEQLNLAPSASVLVLVRGMGLFKDLPLGIATCPMAFNQDVKALVTKTDVLPRYLAYALRARRKVLMDRVDSSGHGTGRLSTDYLEELPISFPSVDRQKMIVATLDAATRDLRQTARVLDRYQVQKKAVLQRILGADESSADKSLARPGKA